MYTLLHEMLVIILYRSEARVLLALVRYDLKIYSNHILNLANRLAPMNIFLDGSDKLIQTSSTPSSVEDSREKIGAKDAQLERIIQRSSISW